MLSNRVVKILKNNFQNVSIQNDGSCICFLQEKEYHFENEFQIMDVMYAQLKSKGVVKND